MPPFTALLNTHNDALRLGRTLEMLLPSAEIVIVDHDSSDATFRIAREYGARVVKADSSLTAGLYLDFARNHWIFCIQPGESINESLQCSLFEWNLLSHDEVAGHGFSVFSHEQARDENWIRSPEPEVRLVQRHWNRWRGKLPASKPGSVVLEGELLRFAQP
jgi:glycosyltransferase involved in cell wall biosynthesis